MGKDYGRQYTFCWDEKILVVVKGFWALVLTSFLYMVGFYIVALESVHHTRSRIYTYLKPKKKNFTDPNTYEPLYNPSVHFVFHVLCH